MLRKDLVIPSFGAEEVVETYYFHMSLSELIELNFNTPGGLAKKLQDIVDGDNPSKLLSTFKELIFLSVGRRVGDRFLKNDEIRKDFEETGAYSAMFADLATNAGEAVIFVNSVFPKELLEKAKELTPADGNLENVELPKEPVKPASAYTRGELLDMSNDDFAKLLRTHKNNLTKDMLVASQIRRNFDSN